MAAVTSRSRGRRYPGRLRRPRRSRSSFYRTRQPPRCPAAPSVSARSLRPARAGIRAGLPARRTIPRSLSRRRLCHIAGRGPVSLLHPHHVPALGAGGRNSRAPRSTALTPLIRSPNCWPPLPISSGAGTSPSCWAPPSGPTSTSTSSWTSSAATWSAGWWRLAKPPNWRSGSSNRHLPKQNIAPGQLTVHADRGSSMTSKPVAFLMADLGVTKTHSRPYVSDDNPYSESQFRTLKYRPDFPERFGSIQDSRSFCQQFFPWYNQEHRHSGIELLTPAMVHYGQAPAIVKQRQVVLACRIPGPPGTFRASGRRNPPLSQRRCGSTSRQKTKVSKFRAGVSQSH